MPQAKVGTVIHYFDKLSVAIIKLTGKDLKIGDKVQLISKTGKTFNQKVTSLQIEHAQIDIAQKGDEFGLKTTSAVKDKSDVVKLT